MKITADEARSRLADIEIKYRHGTLRMQQQWRENGTWNDSWEAMGGYNVVGEHDEDYVLDALFDIPNR